MNDKLKQIADFYGLEIQVAKLAEECAEFSAAVFKRDYYEELRHESSARFNLDLIAKKSIEAHEKMIEELADVLLMARQVEYLLDGYLLNGYPSYRESVNRHMEVKVKRQLRRIAEEKAK